MDKHRLSRTSLFFAAAAALFLFVLPAAAETRFHILMVNDPHSYILPYMEAAPDGSAVPAGGLDRALWLVRQERAAIASADSAPIFFLEGGDLMLGLKGSTFSGEPEYESLSLLGCDAGVLGNHDFDGGVLTLAKLCRLLKFPVLASNIRFYDKNVGKCYARTTVIERGGVRIGCFGLVTPLLKSIIDDPSGFSIDEDVIGVARKCVSELTAQGCSIIVAINHVGLDWDKKLAQNVAGIDVIVGGHSHDAIGEKLVVTGPDGGKTLIGQAGLDGRYAGRFDVAVDEEGRLIEDQSSWKLLSVGPDTPAVAEIEKIGMAARAGLAKALEIGNPAVVFTVPVDGRREAVRAGESALGDLVTDAMRWRLNARVSLLNGGSIRVGRLVPKGDFTPNDMLDLLPYGTKTVRVLVTGAELKKQLEIAASSLVGVNDHYEPALRCYNGEFLQMSGLRVVYDTTKTPAQVVARRMTKPGARVASLLIDGSGGWTPVEDDQVYSVGTSEFAVKEWNCLLCEKTNETDMHALDTYLEEVLHRRAAPAAEGRITIIR